MEKEVLKNVSDEKQVAMDVAKKPFLLLDIARVDENVHARIIARLLTIVDKRGNYLFLQSFLEQFNLPEMLVGFKQPIITAQNGLFIEYKDVKGDRIKVFVENAEQKESDGEYHIHIHYQDELLPWLESELPSMPVGVDSTLASGMHQYVAYLKWCGMAEQSCESAFSKDCEGIANNEWAIHFTSSFLCLYKKSWANADERKYSIPSIYLCISYGDFAKAKELNWHLNVDHVTPDIAKRSESSRFPDKMFQLLSNNHAFNLCNHNRAAYLSNVMVTQGVPLGSMEKTARTDYYKQLLASDAVTKLVEEIDSLIPER